MKTTYKKLSAFIKAEMLLNVLMIIAGSLMGPVLVKIKGMVFTVTVLGILMMIDKLNILFSLLIKNISMSNKHRLVLVSVILEFIVISMFSFIEIETFIWLLTIVSMLTGITLNAFFIDYDVILADMLDKKDFGNLAYIERTLFGFAGIIGTGFAIMLGELKAETIMNITGVMVFIVILVTMRQHFLYYKEITIDNYKDKTK